ncbi:hypothetical protein WISP_23650 [Willisornis vidua]|uniref:NB-ARC domain-containing protein n=1 Tax=Willisornis vidua TaxID=1566151 RepID=A0ABQ9DT74_9PASS|nr:hypothetical protein WISP_23650 [Willisornis vidua]
MDGYRLFWRDKQGKRGGEVALYVREYLDSIEPQVSDDKVDSLWVRIRGKANKADILVGVCCRLSNQDEEGEKLFYKQLVDVSKSSALILVGDFIMLDICWEFNRIEERQSRKFLECMEDNFLLQLINEPTRGGSPLDLQNREGLVGDVVIGGSLVYGNHKMMKFSVLTKTRWIVNKTSTLDFWRTDFGLFRRLVQRVPWETALRNKRVQEGWTYFKK